MNISKEDLRKLLEDCWRACETYSSMPFNRFPDRNTYITSQLSAMSEGVDDGQEGKGLWPPGLRWKKGNEFVISEKELSAFIAEVYTETEWYPDYVAKGEAEESAQTRKDFLRGWTAAIKSSSLPVADGEGEKVGIQP